MKISIAKKRIIYTLAVTLVVVFSTTFAILMTLERTDYRNYLQGEYSKNMYELINSVQNIEDDLSKVAVAGTKDQNIAIFEEIFRYASNASDKLHSLPIPIETQSETSRFLGQVGDFCHALIRSSMEGKELSDEQYALIDSLNSQSYNLTQSLGNILQQINEGRVQWGEIRKKVSGVLAKTDETLVSEKFKGIQKQITQYPALIYDGPFSDNVLEISPRVNDEKEVPKEQIIDFLKKVFGEDRVEKIEEKKSEGSTRIEAYGFNILLKGRKKEENIVCDVSKKGGKIIYLLDNKSMNKPTIDEEKAKDIGTNFLKNIGYKSMTPTYALKYEDTMVISYVYNIEDIAVYTDQVKLKIALDDGSIIGMEAEKYLVSHIENRNLPQIKVSAEEGRKKIGKNVKINNIRLAIIPTELNAEVLCYEYTATHKDDVFKVYINVVNGEPQRIMKIINTPNGQLTM